MVLSVFTLLLSSVDRYRLPQTLSKDCSYKNMHTYKRTHIYIYLCMSYYTIVYIPHRLSLPMILGFSVRVFSLIKGYDIRFHSLIKERVQKFAI